MYRRQGEAGEDRRPALTVRWGIVATGGIATRFVAAMSMVADGEIVGVASRSMDRAQAFSSEHGIPYAYDDVAALAGDDRIDAVYIASPHSGHSPDTLASIAAGKHVLCEKPMALSAAQAEQMVAAARARGTFLMEAVWTRFLPSYQALVGVLAEGRIGVPLLVEADFGFRVPLDPHGRLFDPALGGGAVLDLGIYPLQLCSLVLGHPDRVTADGEIGVTGVDEQVAAVLHHPEGGLGVVKAAIRVPMSCRARISGSEGWIDLPPFMHCPDHLEVSSAGRTDRIEAGFEGDGLRFEIEEVHRCIDTGRTESSVMPLDETISLARTMDRILDRIGVVRHQARDAGAERG